MLNLKALLSKIVTALAVEQVSYGDALLFRIGNLRILQVNGASPHGRYLYAQDRPSVTVRGSASCNDSTANSYCSLGRIHVDPSGLISCYVATVYYHGSTGYSIHSSGYIVGTVVWKVNP